MAEDSPTPPPSATEAEATTVIGIGSSAGGLEAIRELVGNLPAHVSAAYVVVQHMSPQHKSLLTSLIARETDLEVREVENGTGLQAGVIYVTPPNTDVVLRDRKLTLQQPSDSLASPKPSVDRFLKSLAEGVGENAVAIILSGTGSDGAYGVQAIREAGGITIAQDDVSAKYDGMPTSAVETGCVDLVLRPMHIGTHLEKILTRPRDLKAIRSDAEVPDTPLSDLLQVLLATTRVDFRDYKQSTVVRRIERRMTALGIRDQDDYTAFCRSNPREVDALFKDLLISVTRFFRDREEFDALQRSVTSMVAETKSRPYRIWVAGCATGEEAYSIAMLFAEAMGGIEQVSKDTLQIFATDLDRSALQVARRGSYSVAALDEVPQALAQKYFVQAPSDTLRVAEPLRNVILFSEHNICQDPPFLDMHLICCRNLLIYFNNNLQAKVLARLHYALGSAGLLFLGKAESVIGSEDLFIPASQTAHIFRKRVVSNPDTRAWRSLSDQRRVPEISTDVRQNTTSVDRKLFDALARSIGPNALLVSADYQIARIFGDVSAFVELSERSKLNLQIGILRSPFREEARSLITLSLKTNETRNGIKHSNANRHVVHQLRAVPIAAPDAEEKLVLLVFDTHALPDALGAARVAPADGQTATPESERIAELEREVKNTREALHQTIEQLETSNEELQSLNEEMQSTNEELQATNEERETSNEELQSTNEELITVNEELQINAAELSALSSELASILESVPSALIVVDTALQITRASAAAVALFNLVAPMDTPHLSQCATPEGFPRLTEICNECLRLGTLYEGEVNSGGTIYTLMCAPFSDDKGRIRGATLIVITSHVAHALAQEMEFILQNAPLHLLRWSEDGTIQRISAQTAQLLGLSMAEAVGKPLAKYLTPAELSAMERDAAPLLAPDGPTRGPVQVAGLTAAEDGALHWLKIQRLLYTDRRDKQRTVLSLGLDVSDLLAQEDDARVVAAQLALLADQCGAGVLSYDVRQDRVTGSGLRLLGVDQADGVPLEVVLGAVAAADRAALEDRVAALRTGAEDGPAEVALQDGAAMRTLVLRALAGPNGKVTHIYGTLTGDGLH